MFSAIRVQVAVARIAIIIAFVIAGRIVIGATFAVIAVIAVAIDQRADCRLAKADSKEGAIVSACLGWAGRGPMSTLAMTSMNVEYILTQK